MLDNPRLSALQYAFLGDAVFGLMTREWLLSQAARPVAELHALTKGYVNAKAQAGYYRRLEPLLTEEELAVMRGGRNANPKSRAKNATMADYRHATGFEALCGWLYATGQSARLGEVFGRCVSDS